MKTIGGQKFWEKRDILKEYPISERTFFTRVKESKFNYPNYLMNNNFKFWIIHESIINDVFKVVKRPRKTEINRWKKWIKQFHWDIFGNISPKGVTIQGNIQFMNCLFNVLNEKYGNDQKIELVYGIENNSEGEYQHSHFLIRINLSNEEFELIKDEVYNLFPNHDFQRYNHLFGDKGIKYITKHVGDDLNRFGYLSNDYNGK